MSTDETPQREPGGWRVAPDKVGLKSPSGAEIECIVVQWDETEGEGDEPVWVDVAYVPPHFYSELNARMIAASPAMLGFIEWATELMRDDASDGPNWKDFDEYQDGWDIIEEISSPRGDGPSW